MGYGLDVVAIRIPHEATEIIRVVFRPEPRLMEDGCASRDRSMDSASAGSYPLTKCVVSGEDLGDKPYVFIHNGQTVKLCCKDCLADFNKDPDKYMAKLNTSK